MRHIGLTIGHIGLIWVVVSTTALDKFTAAIGRKKMPENLEVILLSPETVEGDVLKGRKGYSDDFIKNAIEKR